MFTLTGTLEDHAGKPVADSAVVIIPSPSITKDASGNTVYLGGTTVYTDSTGKFTASLVADEDNIVYTVRSAYGGPLDQPIHFNSPADGVTIDLADVAPVLAPDKYNPYVVGASAYEIAVKNGFSGTEIEWLDSLADPGLPSTASVDDVLAWDGDSWVARAPRSNIEYVSGTVTPDPGTPVHEYFTTGEAVIAGVSYEAQQAVVIFYIGGTWVHKVVDLPTAPTATHLRTFAPSIPLDTLQESFTLSAGGDLTPKAGVLVATLTTARGAATVSVGGRPMTMAAAHMGTTGIGPQIWYLAVEEGESLDTSITVTGGTGILRASLILVTGVNAVPYTSLNSTNVTPFTVPQSPAGSVIIGHFGKRDLGVTAWDAGVTELVREAAIPSNTTTGATSTWKYLHTTAWAISDGSEAQQLSTAGGDHNAVIFARSA